MFKTALLEKNPDYWIEKYVKISEEHYLVQLPENQYDGKRTINLVSAVGNWKNWKFETENAISFRYHLLTIPHECVLTVWQHWFEAK